MGLEAAAAPLIYFSQPKTQQNTLGKAIKTVGLVSSGKQGIIKTIHNCYMAIIQEARFL